MYKERYIERERIARGGNGKGRRQVFKIKKMGYEVGRGKRRTKEEDHQQQVK